MEWASQVRCEFELLERTRFQFILARCRGRIPGHISSRRDDRIAAEKFFLYLYAPFEQRATKTLERSVEIDLWGAEVAERG